MCILDNNMNFYNLSNLPTHKLYINLIFKHWSTYKKENGKLVLTCLTTGTFRKFYFEL